MEGIKMRTRNFGPIRKLRGFFLPTFWGNFYLPTLQFHFAFLEGSVAQKFGSYHIIPRI